MTGPTGEGTQRASLALSVDGGAREWAVRDPGRGPALVRHLLDAAVDRRLIVGVYNEAADDPAVERAVVAAGLRIAGRREWPKPQDPRVARRVFWIDRDRATAERAVAS